MAFDLTIAERAVTGTRTYARRLLEALQRRSEAVIAWRQADPWPGARGRAGKALGLIAWLARTVPARLAREDVALYHSPCALGPRRAPCPVVITVHDATDLTMRAMYPLPWRVLHRVWGVPAVRKAAAVIVPSMAAREEVARAYGLPLERLCVTPEGVDARFQPMESPAGMLERHGIRPPYALFVGTPGPRKNLERLLEAFASVLRAHPRLRESLVVAGPRGPLAGRLAARARTLGIGDRVVFPGWIDDSDLPALYAGARCLCYPSLAEGFGLPILESMACGVPVLTSNRSSMPEVAGDAAVLVNPLSVEAISEGLVSLLGDEALRRRLITLGRERARAFTWERTAAATEAVYRAVLARRDGR